MSPLFQFNELFFILLLGLLQQYEDAVEYIFNRYINNDSDLASFMLTLVRLELSFKEFEKKLTNFDDESQESIKGQK